MLTRVVTPSQPLISCCSPFAVASLHLAAGVCEFGFHFDQHFHLVERAFAIDL